MTWTPITNIWNQINVAVDINPKDIVVCEECQPRVNGVDSDIVAEYAADMREYDKGSIPGIQMFPQLRCVKTVGDELILVSGFHRLQAMIENEYEKINVSYVEGTFQDAVMLSKQENKQNGVRRTNADIRHVVRTCLLDPKLGQWSNHQIAKWCQVDKQTVANHDKSLAKLASENGGAYSRPTKRKSVNKQGKVELIDTEKIGKNGKSSNAKDKERDAKLKTLEKMRKIIMGVADCYISNGQTNLNQYLTLPELEKGFIVNHDYCANAFKDGMKDVRFGQVETVLKNRNLDQLDREFRAISTYAADVRTWQSSTEASQWVRDLIHQKKAESSIEPAEPDTPIPENSLDQWKQIVKDQIKTWKKKRDGVGYASLTMFLHATLKYHSLPHDTEITCEIYEKLMHLLTTKRTSILEVLVRRQLKGESLWTDNNGDETQDTAIFKAGETKLDILTLTLQNDLGETKEIKFHNNIRILWKLSDKSEERLPCLEELPPGVIDMKLLWQFLREHGYLDD